jgi:hypothetical protein
MTLRRPLAVAIAVIGLVPVLAAGRPACCIAKASPAPKSCCASMSAGAPKGCCKAPSAPKPEARSKAVDAPALIVAAVSVVVPAVVPEAPTVVAVARIARREHRAPSPTDSPPDRLALHQAFLI